MSDTINLLTKNGGVRTARTVLAEALGVKIDRSRYDSRSTDLTYEGVEVYMNGETYYRGGEYQTVAIFEMKVSLFDGGNWSGRDVESIDVATEIVDGNFVSATVSSQAVRSLFHKMRATKRATDEKFKRYQAAEERRIEMHKEVVGQSESAVYLVELNEDDLDESIVTVKIDVKLRVAKQIDELLDRVSGDVHA